MAALPQSSKRLLLVDGNSIINRSFFALAGRGNLTAPDGTPTGALNTYLNTLKKFIDDIKPTHVCTLFDVREPTFRHKMYDGYKAKRKAMPDELAVQMPLLKELLDAMNLPRYELPGYEADDLIGTMARRGEREGYAVFILSGDKDDFQLIDRNTVVMMPVNKAGKTSTEIYDGDALIERYQIGPEDFVVLKAIMGDTSDNIPGIRGIGEKGAIELVKKYKTLDALYEHAHELSPGLEKKVLENRDMAYLSLTLSKIDCDAPVAVSTEDLLVKEPDKQVLLSLFMRLGLRSQMKRWDLEDVVISPAAAAGGEEQTNRPEALPDELPGILIDVPLKDFRETFISMAGQDDFCLTIDMTSPTDSTADEKLVLTLSGELIYAFSRSRIPEIIACLAEQGVGSKSTGILPAGHAIKNRFKCLPEGLPFESCFDVEIAGYILNQIEGMSPSFEMLYEHAAREAYPRGLPSQTDKKSNTRAASLQMDLFAEEPNDASGSAEAEQAGQKALTDSGWKSLMIRRIYACQRKDIAELSLETLIYEIEMPLVLHLDRMEREGVYVDSRILDEIHNAFYLEIARLTESIYEKSGQKFNILSPKQIGTVLFEKLGLPSGRKNAGGAYSTDSDELTRLADEHPVVRDILNYRQVSKLDSTFVLGLKKVIDPSDGRVHSNFSQAMTNTGRLSSSEPNLQNIPIRSDLGSQIRKAFVAREGFVLLDADYSQIELRLLAHLSQDGNMIRAFLNHEDIHTNTAANIFNVPKDMVEPFMRSAAKTVNFSIVYGISDFGLSQDLGVSFQEAHHYIEHYYAQYPKIREYLDSLKKQAYERGFVETMFGRRRVVRELTSPNRNIRAFGERAAMNTPVQGTAADIIKIAMNRVSTELRKANLDASLILQVHDELIIECREDQAEPAARVLKEAMEGAAKLTVPLIAEVNAGKSWYECKR